MKLIAGASLCLLGISSMLHAAERAAKPEFGVALGVSNYMGELDSDGFGLVTDLNVHWWLNDRFALGLRATGARLKGSNDLGAFQSNPNSVTGRFKWLPIHREMFLMPYLTAGVEWATFNAEDQDDGSLHPAYHDFTKSADTNTLAIPVGLGLMHHLSDNWAVSIEGLYHLSSTDFLDDFEDDSANDAWITVTAGLSFFPGQPKDTDGDGILDRDDRCPREAEDMDGFQDSDGCPDLDNDGDGILDADDGCPDMAEDMDGYKDDDGCPEADNDNDGILDADDQCPNDAEDIDGFQDEDGCPDLDNDGDGILDVDDKCPNEAETVNGYKDQDGCPDTKPEVQVEAGKAVVLAGINFDSGKATLTADSEASLNKVLRTLNDNPEIALEVRGYTDNQGRDAFNRTLSQKRAEAVRTWLIEHDVDASRLQAKGFGPDNPVADNATEEGRAQNRRIEFFRLK